MSRQDGTMKAVATTTRTSAAKSRCVREYMTPNPFRVLPEDLAVAAHRQMREKGVRHMPVVRDEAPIGMVSERDIFQGETTLDDSARVQQVMTTPAYVVSPDANVGEVAAGMRRKKLGAAIVAENGRLVGIFTNGDALRALAEMNGIEAS